MKQQIAIIDYGGGNIFSLTGCLERLQIPYVFTSDKQEIEASSHVILPGVGHAATAMHKLTENDLQSFIPQLTQPVLGICLGMQLLTAFSEEGEVDLLHCVPLKTQKFPVMQDLKIPHMGWNRVVSENALFKGMTPATYFYFVHSYYVNIDEKYTAAQCDYGIPFSAAIQKDNFYGVQFHPEKSGEQGAQLIQNFYSI